MSSRTSGGLSKTCVLFGKSATILGIFVKNVFQDVSKPEEITEHAGLHYHLAAMDETECFIKNLKNTRGGVLLLVKLQTKACNFPKRNTLPLVFSRFLNCANGTKSRSRSNY